MMKRREFTGRLSGAALAAAAGPGAAAKAAKKNPLMHVGGDYHSVAGPGIASTENLEYNLRCGVRHLTAKAGNLSPDGSWDFDELRRIRDACGARGVELEAIRMDAGYIRLPKGAGRDREIERIISNIGKASRVGVKVITYHWTVIPIRRNRNTPGRGNATYAGFKLEENWRDLPVTKSGRVSSGEYWERIAYFLERVIPAAREHHSCPKQNLQQHTIT